MKQKIFNSKYRSKLTSKNNGKPSKRRSSVAVMAGGATLQQNELRNLKTKSYFESHHLNLETSRQLVITQSNSAVHYLAISPPRISITDDKGAVSPEPDISESRSKGL